jgi:DNA polymerase-3 subunit delta
MLLRADLDLKGSWQLPPRTILEKLLVELGRPRRD